jgi:hypothetical protein
VVAGVDTPVALHLGPAVSWLVTLVAVGGTSVFLGVTVLVCALAGRWALIARLDLAIATTLLYRLCTTYLPPIWGWGALAWLRRHDEL